MESTAQNNRSLCESLIDAFEDDFIANDNLGDIQAQAGAEFAGFGDAWPGAAEDLHRARQGVKRAAADVRWFEEALGIER